MALVPANYLVPPQMQREQQHQIQQKQQLNNMMQPIKQTILQELHDAMTKILKDPNMPEDDKVKEYNHLFYQFRQVLKQNPDQKQTIAQMNDVHDPLPLLPAPPPLPPTPSSNILSKMHQQQQQVKREIKDVTDKTGDIEPLIAKVSSAMRPYAKNFIKAAKESNGILGWNEKDELLFRGHPVSGTNIVQIIRTLNSPRLKQKEPCLGLDVALHGIAALAVDPSKLIMNNQLLKRTLNLRGAPLEKTSVPLKKTVVATKTAMKRKKPLSKQLQPRKKPKIGAASKEAEPRILKWETLK